MGPVSRTENVGGFFFRGADKSEEKIQELTNKFTTIINAGGNTNESEIKRKIMYVTIFLTAKYEIFNDSDLRVELNEINLFLSINKGNELTIEHLKIWINMATHRHTLPPSNQTRFTRSIDTLFNRLDINNRDTLWSDSIIASNFLHMRGFIEINQDSLGLYKAIQNYHIHRCDDPLILKGLINRELQEQINKPKKDFQNTGNSNKYFMAFLRLISCPTNFKGSRNNDHITNNNNSRGDNNHIRSKSPDSSWSNMIKVVGIRKMPTVYDSSDVWIRIDLNNEYEWPQILDSIYDRLLLQENLLPSHEIKSSYDHIKEKINEIIVQDLILVDEKTCLIESENIKSCDGFELVEKEDEKLTNDVISGDEQSTGSDFEVVPDDYYNKLFELGGPNSAEQPEEICSELFHQRSEGDFVEIEYNGIYGIYDEIKRAEKYFESYVVVPPV